MELITSKLKCVDNFASVKQMEDGVLTAVASNASKDRDQEIIEPKAFKKYLHLYRTNPVILASHTHRTQDGSPPIIGSAKRIELSDDSLEFDMTFASHPNAQAWRGLYEEGHAKAFSVGFMPIKGQMKDQEDGTKTYVHTEVELFEISAVAVGSNREALSRDISPDIIKAIQEALGDMEKKNQEFRDQLSAAQAKSLTELEELIEALGIRDNPVYRHLFDGEPEADDPSENDVQQLNELQTAIRSI